jgi:hypothetical protein
MDLTPWKTEWMRFTDYYTKCDIFGMLGAVYGMVWTEFKPEPYEMPHTFSGCVYVGESGGNYYDKQGPVKGKFRSHLHKRMTAHHKPLTTGIVPDDDRKYSLFIDQFGHGDDVLNGKIYKESLWLGLTLPRPNLPERALKAWLKHEEHRQITHHIVQFDRCPLMNIEVKGKGRQESSHSNERLKDIVKVTDF